MHIFVAPCSLASSVLLLVLAVAAVRPENTVFEGANDEFVLPAWLLRETALADAISSDEAATSLMEGDWVLCAHQGAPIQAPVNVGVGNLKGRFGQGSTWKKALLPAGTSCATETFQDHHVDVVQKHCECWQRHKSNHNIELLEEDDLGLVGSWCAQENGPCECPSGHIRFGVGNRWVYTQASELGNGAIMCAASTFDGVDPVPGQYKECWCLDADTRQQAQARSGREETVAIVTMSRHQPDLRAWLLYHLEHMSVQNIFIFFEGTAWEGVLSSLSSAHRERVIVLGSNDEVTGESSRPANNYEAQMVRQQRVENSAIAASRKLGLDWLIHIDDDELLYTPVRRSVGEILAALPAHIQQVKIPNTEVLYNKIDKKTCFESDKMNINPHKYVAYANGKNAVRLNTDVRSYGVHDFIGANGGQLTTYRLETEAFGTPLVNLHFESCTFARWRDKFYQLAKASDAEVSKIPFPFYRQSIKLMQSCGVDGYNESVSGCAKRELEHFWQHWKMQDSNRYAADDFFPIRIPWAQLEKPSSRL